MKNHLKKHLAVWLAAVMALSCFQFLTTLASEPKQTYELYPSVHEIRYAAQQTELKKQINVVVEDGIDTYTRAKIEQVMGLKELSIQQGNLSYSNEVVSGKTNVLLGIYNSHGVVDAFFKEQNIETSHFTNTDAYTLMIEDDTIAILGKDTDATFYGITTLKEIFQQMETNVMEELTIFDYADIKGRGFIEGYYGDPWSVEDRAELMRFGGDYKLNNYVYAPKDDPYHNKNWRTLYDDEKLKDIEYLAKAGNESKCYYVYALHTFMYNAVRFDTEAHYQEDLEIIKQKFTQVMNVGVRQFAILADDAGVPQNKPSNYIRLMNDLDAWMKEKAKTVSGLKTDILFCPHDYWSNQNGWERDELQEMHTLKQLPSSVSIIQTGGTIWGHASDDFINSFYNYMERPVYLWINWPCSDNTKDSLIMDGNEEFLQPNIDARKVDGIILNPMQQSEANKSALFANADYTWNVWESNEEARENWEDSFKYMDHQNALETESSTALRELSRHMKNSNTGQHGESSELAPKLTAFLRLFQQDGDYIEQAEELIAEFTQLKEYAAYYKANPGNPRTRDQIIYWLDCFEESMDAGIHYLHAAIALKNEATTDDIWNYFTNGQAAFELSKTHSYHYVDHLEYAAIGTAHIKPFLEDMESELSMRVSPMVNPNIQLTTFITSRTDSPSLPSGKTVLETLTDGSTSSEAVWKVPNETFAGDYIGIRYTKPIELKTVAFQMATSSNPNDTFGGAKIQYTTDGKNWQDIAGTEVSSTAQTVKAENLELKVLGVRLIATKDRNNMWLGCREIEINKQPDVSEEMQYQIIKTPEWNEWTGGGQSEANLHDGNDDTSAEYYWSNNTSKVGDYIGYDLGNVFKIGDVHFVIGGSREAENKWINYKLEYSTDNVHWTTFKEYTGVESGKDVIDENLGGISARYIRMTNMQEVSKWVHFSEMDVKEYNASNMQYNIIRTPEWNEWTGGGQSEANLHDGNDDTSAEYYWSNNTSKVGDYIGYDLGDVFKIGDVHFVIGGSRVAANKWIKYKMEYSLDNVNWTTYKEYTGVSSGKDVIDENLGGISARYIRMTNMQEVGVWVHFSEMDVKEYNASNMQYNIIRTPEWNEWTGSGQSEANLHDGSDDTSAEYYLPGNKSIVGDYIGYDLGDVFKIGDVHVVIGGSRVATNKWLKYKMEYSLDNVNWTTYKEYTGVDSGKDVIDENLGGISARYIRMTNMQEVGVWVHFSEFDVKEFDEETTSQFIYTNTNLELSATHSDDRDAMIPTSITLADQEYIGFKFERIKDLNQVILNFANEDGLILQVSNNAVHWETITDRNQPGIGRYVRLLNQSGADIQTSFQSFIVTSNEVKDPSLKDSTVPIITSWGDTRENGAAFDNDLNTTTKFAGLPNAGNYILYDLGQTRHLNNVKLYCQDSAMDYIRDANMYLSDDTNNWGDPIMQIGDGIENSDDGNISALQSGIYQTSSRYPNKVYAESIPFQKSGRYLKIEFTARNQNRAVMFNEIILNDGEYVPAYNDPTFVSNPIETAGFVPQHVLDGDLKTTYKPDTSKGATSGSLLYRLSEHTDTKRFNILQSGANISKADVMIRGYRKGETTISEAKIGQLERTLNAFENYDFDHIFEIEIRWNQIAPTIQEIILFDEYEIVNGDITKLQTLYDQNKDKLNSDLYTPSSKQIFDKAMEQANKVIQMPVRTQYLIDDTFSQLNKAIQSLKEKADDIQAFMDLFDEVKDYEETAYLQYHWKEFTDSLQNAQGVYDAIDECTQADVDEVYGNLKTAVAKLVAKQTLNDKRAYLEAIQQLEDGTDYTKQTLDAFMEKVEHYENILNDEANLTNAAMKDMEKELDQLKQDLVSLKPLKDAIQDAEKNFGESAYDPEVWSEYQRLLKQANDTLAKENATKEEVQAAVKACEDAKAMLKANATQALQNELDRLSSITNEDHRYTAFTFDALQNVIHDANTYLQDHILDDETTFEWITKLQDAENALVELSAINDLLNEINALNKAWFTANSWSAMENAVADAQKALEREDLSKNDVAEFTKALTDTKAALVDLRALQEVLENAKEIKDVTIYTPISAKAFTDAYQHANEILVKEDASAEEVADACQVLSDAQSALMKKADKTAANELLNSLKPIIDQKDEYVEEGFIAFVDAYQKLEKLNSDDNVEQSMLDQAMKSLQNAFDQLEKPIFKESKEGNVSLEATTAVLPENVELIVTVLECSDVINQLPTSFKFIYPLDISLYLNGVKIQPTGSVKIRIRIPDGMNRNKMMLYHIKDQAKEVAFEIIGNDIVFEANDFSPYVLVELDESNPVKPSTPNRPTNPKDPMNSSNTATQTITANKTPVTGDGTHLCNWMFICLGMVVAMCWIRKTQAKNNKM